MKQYCFYQSSKWLWHVIRLPQNNLISPGAAGFHQKIRKQSLCSNDQSICQVSRSRFALESYFGKTICFRKFWSYLIAHSSEKRWIILSTKCTNTELFFHWRRYFQKATKATRIKKIPGFCNRNWSSHIRNWG